MIRFPSLFAALLVALAVTAHSQGTATSWTNVGADSSWNNPANWSAGVPGSQSAVTISVQPMDSLIGVDTGSVSNPIGSLTFGASLNASTTITKTFKPAVVAAMLLE